MVVRAKGERRGSGSHAGQYRSEFFAPAKQSLSYSRRVVFGTPQGGTRPSFVKASYPVGDGVSTVAEDYVRLLAAMGRQAFVTLSFDVDADGHPVHFQIEKANQPARGQEAISLVSGWRFTPGSKDGKGDERSVRWIWFGEKSAAYPRRQPNSVRQSV